MCAAGTSAAPSLQIWTAPQLSWKTAGDGLPLASPFPAASLFSFFGFPLPGGAIHPLGRRPCGQRPVWGLCLARPLFQALASQRRGIFTELGVESRGIFERALPRLCSHVNPAQCAASFLSSRAEVLGEQLSSACRAGRSPFCLGLAATGTTPDSLSRESLAFLLLLKPLTSGSCLSRAQSCFSQNLREESWEQETSGVRG